MRPFCSLKRRVASIFRRRRSSSNDSWGDSTQTVVNQMEERPETDSCNSSNLSIHSDWSELLLVDKNNQPSTSTNVNNNNKQVQNTPIKKTMKNIVLVPYKPKPKDWGNWHIKSPNTTNTVENVEQDAATTEYVPRSPYYSPVHSPQFYGDE